MTSKTSFIEVVDLSNTVMGKRTVLDFTKSELVVRERPVTVELKHCRFARGPYKYFVTLSGEAQKENLTWEEAKAEYALRIFDPYYDKE